MQRTYELTSSQIAIIEIALLEYAEKMTLLARNKEITPGLRTQFEEQRDEAFVTRHEILK